MRLLRILGLSKVGQPYTGTVVRWNEGNPRLAMGFYGIGSDGNPDRKCRVEGNHADGWVRV